MKNSIKEITDIAKLSEQSEDSVQTIRACSFTGHRAIKKEHEQIVADRLSRAVEYAYSKGCRIFYCGGAVGFDTLAAKEVLRFSITHRDAKLHLILPCQNQDEKWSEEQKSTYHYILKNADFTEYVSDAYTPTCMMDRNQRLSELGDILIAYIYYSRSGAGQTVRMAKRLGKPVYNVAPSDI